MIEVEAKMRLTDPATVRDRLRSLGAERQTALMETNTFFDTREGVLKAGDQGLRIRIEQNGEKTPRSIITHKGPRAHGKLKSRNETEVVVADPRHAAALLGALGYQPVLTFEKRRERWALDGCTVELDSMPYLGEFIEVEGRTDEAVLAVREKLGLADAPILKSSYIAMLTTYMRENHITLKHVRFEDAVTPAGA